MNFDAMAERASSETGVRWTSNIVNVVRLAFVEPGLWLYILGSAVPAFAALVVLAAGSDRRAG